MYLVSKESNPNIECIQYLIYTWGMLYVPSQQRKQPKYWVIATADPPNDIVITIEIYVTLDSYQIRTKQTLTFRPCTSNQVLMFTTLWIIIMINNSVIITFTKRCHRFHHHEAHKKLQEDLNGHP